MHLFTSLDYMIISLLSFCNILCHIIVLCYHIFGSWPLSMYLKKISEQEEMVDDELILSPYIWLMKFIQLSLSVVLDYYLSINSNMCSMHVKRHLCVFHCCGALCYAFSYIVVCLHCIIKIKNTNLHTC
jgi:hypothetical protein